MIIHNVYFWLKSEVTEDQKNAFLAGIKTFLSQVDEVAKSEVGRPAGTPSRDVVDHDYGYAMFVWFRSVEDHDVYQAHPAHHEFIEKYKDLWAKVQVLDSELLP